MSLFAVQREPLSTDACLSAVASPECGGLALFLGAVRNHERGLPVTLLEYHAYESMAQKQLRRIGEQIQVEIPGVRVAATHRVGSLAVGDIAVICAAAAPHRDEAFRACRLLIDRIKAEVPIWKREHGPDGPYWVGWQDARCRGHHHHTELAHTTAPSERNSELLSTQAAPENCVHREHNSPYAASRVDASAAPTEVEPSGEPNRHG